MIKQLIKLLNHFYISKETVNFLLSWISLYLSITLVLLVYNKYSFFNYPYILLHYKIYACLLLVLILLVYCVFRVFNQNIKNSLGQLLIFFFITSLAIFYSLNLISFYYWGDCITYNLTLEYLLNFNELIAISPINFSFEPFLILLLMAFVFLKIAKKLTDNWFNFFNYFEQKTLPNKIILAALLVLTLYLPLVHSKILYLAFDKFIFKASWSAQGYYTLITVIIILLTAMLLLLFWKWILKESTNHGHILQKNNRWILLLLWGGMLIGLGSNINESIKVFEGRQIAEEPFWCFFNNTSFMTMNIQNIKEQKLEKDYIESLQVSSIVPNNPNVIIIVADALRADHTSIYGYRRPTTPFLDSLFQEKKLSKVSIGHSTCATSYCGILSILGAKHFQKINPYNYKIHDYLKKIGYNINFFISGSHSNWYNLKAAYGESVDNYVGENMAGYGLADDEKIIAAIRAFNPELNQPNFFYIHLMSSHNLGFKHEKYKRYPYTKPQSIEINWPNLINNYDNGVIQTDAIVAQIFKELDYKGMLQNSFIIITSDHGEELGETDKSSHGWNLDYQETNIPILIYDSGANENKILDYGSHIDIAPTIAKRLGLPIPNFWLGQSLFHSKKNYFTFHENASRKTHKAVIWWGEEVIYKYIEYIENHKRKEKLFDILNDPKQQNNLIKKLDKEELLRLKTAFSNHWKKGNIE